MSNTFNEIMKNRRSIYGISKDATIDTAKIKTLVHDAVLNTPSAFNSQSAKTAILFGEHHNKFWDIVMETLKKIVPEENFEPTKAKINSFAAGQGTILYFDDTAVTDGFAAQFPLYKDNFPVFADHSNAMLQFAIWCQLESEGLGATLQHYNPLVDTEVKDYFKIPTSWRLIAQMPFGKPTAKAPDKEFVPVENRVMIFE